MESNLTPTPELSEYNEKLLKGAYRHPFEYINPRLYRKKDMNYENLDQELLLNNEEEFNHYMREERGTVVKMEEFKLSRSEAPTSSNLK